MRELQRSGAFERSVLVLVTPTGTGWIDPAAMNAVEYLHHGDIASVALQYSYLNSPLALLVEADYGRDVARALFAEIYGYWTELPAERRPRLYLHGLSLGALHSQRSRSCTNCSAIPSTARFGAVRRFAATCGARSPTAATRTAPNGVHGSVMAASSAS